MKERACAVAPQRLVPSAFVVAMVCASGCLTPTAPRARPALELTIHADPSRSYEGAPLYIAVELRNAGRDTAWINTFGFAFGPLRGTLMRDDGTEFRDRGIVADVALAPGWLGSPLGPDESTFEVVVLQDRWGESDSVYRDLYDGKSVPRGGYDLFVEFEWSTTRLSTTRLRERPILARSPTFGVHARTLSEDTFFRRVRELAGNAWEPATRAGFLDSTLSLIDQVVTVDPANEFLPWLARRLIVTASVLGSPPDSVQRARLSAVLEAVAERERETPMGVYAVAGVSEFNPAGIARLTAVLGGSLAGRYAIALQRSGVAQIPGIKAPR